MSLMCPMQGCKEKQGMCGHEKLMMFMVVVVAIVLLVRHFL